jgi:hypothetical protein
LKPGPVYLYSVYSSDNNDISKLEKDISMEFYSELYYISSLKSEHGLGLLEYQLDQQEINFLDYCNQTIQEYIVEKNEYCEKIYNYCIFAINSTIDKDSFHSECNFSFIKDESLKNKLILDWDELKTAYQNHLYKTTIIHVISIIEGLLIYSLIQSEKEALKSYSKIYKKEQQKNIKEWKMFEILEISKDIGILEKVEKKFICIIKDYRNLVHPYSNTTNEDYKISHRTAYISLKLLDIIYESVGEYIQKTKNMS